jgi:hypothetical protein
MVCSGAAALTTLLALQAGSAFAPGVAPPADTGATASVAEAPFDRGLAFGRGALMLLPLLWSLALLWGAVATWILRRLRRQTLATYLGAALLFGSALGALGLASARLTLSRPLPAERSAIVMIAFLGGWLVGLAAYWAMRRRESRG